ncbi:MAG TPA: AAA family ATPase [Candidatus Paceibacterota bacterium]|nr:AAA family ATPase [Candidatus Paceibacterota bacterium]
MFDQPASCDPDELTPDEKIEALIEADAHKRRVMEGAEYELLKREIRRMADALEHEDDRLPVIRSLSDELALPDEEQAYAIDRLLPLGGNALFAGRYKAGKTTFNGQLLKAWADAEHGAKFLGEFECYPDPERPVVTIFNYEMSEAQFRRWLRRVGIRNTHNVNVVHLRGLSLVLALPAVRERVAGWLRESRTGLWIVDPASRAMAGMGDGSDNKDVNLFVGWLDEIKAMAGVRDMVLNIHMSHAAAVDKSAERALGAQAWSAWADALWFLTLEEKGGVKSRWFHADGRDVSMDKMLVSYQAEDMSVALVDIDPERHEESKMENAILECITQNPGCSTRVIRDSVTGSNTKIAAGLERLIRDQKVIVREGAGNKREHFDRATYPTLPPTLNGQVQDPST